ncbi:MAG: L-alanine exporter AlaE [Candidatus Woesearchaeota archaeon]|jgi:hypothetical protein
MTLESLLKDKETQVDTLSKVTYSLVTGVLLDYFSAGYRGMEIFWSRATATGINTVTGHPYQRWREGWYQLTKTKKDSSELRKGLVELGAFNTFETYIYGASLAMGSLLSTGTVDFEKVREGMLGLITISPIIAPTLGWYMDGMRKIFGLNSASQQSIKTP